MTRETVQGLLYYYENSADLDEGIRVQTVEVLNEVIAKMDEEAAILAKKRKSPNKSGVVQVDPETGKDVTEDRIVRTEGDVVAYATKHPDMNDSMKRLQGCTIKYDLKERVNIRQFGVSNDKATKKDVTQTNIGKWNLVGKVKPDNWEV